MQTVHVFKQKRDRAKIRRAKAILAKEIKRLESSPPDYPVSNIDGIRDIYIHINFDFSPVKVEHIYFTKARAINRYNVYVDNVFKFTKGMARAWRELMKDSPRVLSERSI